MTKILPVEQPSKLPDLAPRSDATSLMEAIVRLTTSPQFNPEGIERMMVMYERMADREAQVAFNEAMAAAQAEMDPVRQDSNNSQTHSKYASYYALDKVVRPIYSKHGFSLSYNTGEATNPADVRVICYVALGGHIRDYHIDMPADGKGAKGGDVMTRTHATGSAVQYGKRYLLGMIFNIAVTKDDDGNAASPRPAPPRPATASQSSREGQIAELRALLDNSPEREKEFCNRHVWKGASLDNLTPEYFGQAKELILRANAKRSNHDKGMPVPHPTMVNPPPMIDHETNPMDVERMMPLGKGAEMVDVDTGEVIDRTLPPIEEESPRPPRPGARSAAPPQAGHGSKAERSTHAANATGQSHQEPSEPVKLNPLVEAAAKRAPDFATAPIGETLAYCMTLYELAEDAIQLNEIYEAYVDPHIELITQTRNRDSIIGTFNRYLDRFAP